MLSPEGGAAFGAADDLVQEHRHDREHRDQRKSRGRIEAVSEYPAVVADAAGGDIEFSKDNTQQGAGHGKSQSGKKARRHMRQHDMADSLESCSAHSARSVKMHFFDALYASDDVEDDEENTVAEAERNL